MAYELTAASSQTITGNFVSSIGTPHTIAAWAYPNNTTGDHRILRVQNANSAANFISLDGSAVNDPAAAFSRTSVATFASALSTASFSAAIWAQVSGVFSTTSSRTIYLGGGSSGTNTSTTDTASFETVSIGLSTGTTSQLLAQLAVWDVALTAAEIISLSKGFKPSRIRPQNLVFYAPLTRNLQDLMEGITLTNNGSAPVVANPRVY